MASVLILFAHPVYSKSRTQRALVDRCSRMEGVTFNDLYQQYPDLYIDIKREQQLVENNDIIIFQHPFYWYSGPAMIKQWLDLVLEYTWAYGPGGNAMKGKKMMHAISSGGSKEAYGEHGVNRFSIAQFLLPYRQTAELCQVAYLPPFVLHGTYQLGAEALERYALQYEMLIKALVNDQLPVAEYASLNYMNDLRVLTEVR